MASREFLDICSPGDNFFFFFLAVAYELCTSTQIVATRCVNFLFSFRGRTQDKRRVSTDPLLGVMGNRYSKDVYAGRLEIADAISAYSDRVHNRRDRLRGLRAYANVVTF